MNFVGKYDHDKGTQAGSVPRTPAETLMKSSRSALLASGTTRSDTDVRKVQLPVIRRSRAAADVIQHGWRTPTFAWTVRGRRTGANAETESAF